MYLKKFLAPLVGTIMADVVSAAKTRFAPRWVNHSQNSQLKEVKMGMMKKCFTPVEGLILNDFLSALKIQSLLLTFILMVATLWVGPALAAEKKMVKDPGTGEMVTAPEYGGTLTIGMKTEPKNIDSWLGHPSAVSFSPVLEKLGILDWTADRSIFPFGYFSPAQYVRGALVESWEQPDPVTYVLRIRQGVRWHNKAPMNARALTARDVEWNYHRYLGLGSGFSKGSPFIAQWGPLDDAGIVSVEATDPQTVVFKLAKANPNGFVIIFSDNNSAHINGPEVIQQHGEIVSEEKIEEVQILTNWQHLVGTGPFMLTDWSKGTSLTFQKNADYWAHDEKYPQYRLPYVDGVKMLILPEEATRLAALRAGRLDFVGGLIGSAQIVSIDQVENLKKTKPRNPAVEQSIVLGQFDCI